VDEMDSRVRDILTKRDGDLKAIAQRLLDKEVLEGDELQALLGDHKTL
jgi:ATP-dependent Zn protease